jgi:hypothetical protein
MNARVKWPARQLSSLRSMSKLLEQYGCGPIQFTGTNDALYQRHILFNNVVNPEKQKPRGTVMKLLPARSAPSS